ncbi:hypothetical protein BG004_002510 [Podila humilis]|nr:hypothetical protein BG004_002510 [Podila humilis]
MEYTIPESIRLRVNLRCGEPLSHCRARNSWPDASLWDFKWREHSLSDIERTVNEQVRETLQDGLEWPYPHEPYLKPNSSASQKAYLKLTEADYDEKIKAAWRLEAKRLKRTEDIIVDVFAYLREKSQSGQQHQRVVHSHNGGDVVAPAQHSSNNSNNYKKRPAITIKTSDLRRALGLSDVNLSNGIINLNLASGINVAPTDNMDEDPTLTTTTTLQRHRHHQQDTEDDKEDVY